MSSSNRLFIPMTPNSHHISMKRRGFRAHKMWMRTPLITVCISLFGIFNMKQVDIEGCFFFQWKMVKYSLTLQNRETCFVRKHSPILSSKHGHIYRPQTKLRESNVLQAYVCPRGGAGGGG